MRYLILDVSSSALPDAESYLEGTVRAPSNYGPEAAEKYVREKQAERVQMAATDIDLARITGIAAMSAQSENMLLLTVGPTNSAAEFETYEREYIKTLGIMLQDHRTIITFGGFGFDIPLLMRRARYLGINFPNISTDRFKSPHRDLCEELSDRNPQRRRSLQFYAKRLGWTDIRKPLSGAEEAQVPQTNRWNELAESLQHDVTATYRLAQWLGVVAREAVSA